MFRWISIFGFATVFCSLFLHNLLFSFGRKPRCSVGSIVRKKLCFETLASGIRTLIILLGFLSFCGLLMTGFCPLMTGVKLQGYWLMLHATLAPVFMACSAIIIFLKSGECTFIKNDAEIQKTDFKCEGKSCWFTDTGLGVKIGYWLLASMTLPVILTMVLSMLTLFGTEGQRLLFEMHRWSALIFAWIAIVELYMLIRMNVVIDTQ